MAMDKTGMKAKVKAAYASRTELAMSEGDFNVLIDLCQGIIEEIIANSVVTGEVTVTGGSSAGTYPLNAGAKVSG